MNNEVLVGLVAFFSAVVACLTAAIGYFKVYKTNGRQHESFEDRLRQCEVDRSELRERVDRLEKSVVDLKRENYLLLKSNEQLRREQGK